MRLLTRGIILGMAAITAACGTQHKPKSNVKDINTDDKVRYEKATLFSALDENYTGHVFFKQCMLSSDANRNCEELGESHSLPDGVTYQNKIPVRSYELQLPEDKRTKILSALLANQDVTFTYPGGVTNGDLSEEEIRIAFSPFDWPVGSGSGSGSGPGGPIPGNCADGYVHVPGNYELGTSEFCVMKYEAKDIGGQAKSRATRTPWVSIDRYEAQAACSDVGASLISNAQWQTIARNIESVSSNWSGGQIGSGSLNRGHSNGRSALKARGDENSRWSKNKRTHTLSNGEVIWDLAGNVWEWVSDDNNSKQGAGGWVSQEPWDRGGKLKWGPKGNYQSKDNGEYGGLGFSGIHFDSGAVMRGGGWMIGTYAGVFHATLSWGPLFSSGRIGFRCVRPLR